MLIIHIIAGLLVQVTDAQTACSKSDCEVTSDVGFYYRKLSTIQSKYAILEYRIISRPEDLVQLDFYTTSVDEHVNIKRQCSHQVRGQLNNKDFHCSLKRGHYNNIICEHNNDNLLFCRGKLEVQDYIPRDFAFSFGFSCNDIRSLKGLKFNVTIHSQTNETTCYPVARNSFNCSVYYPDMTLPNLLGNCRQSSAFEEIEKILLVDETLSTQGASISLLGAYQHMREMMCLFHFPKCNATTKTATPPCRELCLDAQNSCGKVTELLDVIAEYNCDYLPPMGGNITCFYKSVTCGPPPKLNNAKLLVEDNANENPNETVFPLHFEVVYSCEKKLDEMVGNPKVRCLHSGSWSELPRCEPKAVLLVTTSGCLGVAVLVCIAILIILRRSRKVTMTRRKEFDVYVCYNHDHDINFVIDHILEELEEKYIPPFRICIHDRDFMPGRPIVHNIQEAIEKSNSTIIVMSQGFVDSPWCREEFQKCVQESHRDPAFQLFVILRQPTASLINTTDEMEKFFTRQTYLKEEDDKKIQKIADYLYLVKRRKLCWGHIVLK